MFGGPLARRTGKVGTVSPVQIDWESWVTRESTEGAGGSPVFLRSVRKPYLGARNEARTATVG